MEVARDTWDSLHGVSIKPENKYPGAPLITDRCDDGEIQHDEEKDQGQRHHDYGEFEPGHILLFLMLGFLLLEILS